MEHLQTHQAACMKDNGKKINNMDMGQNPGNFIKLGIKVNF